MNEAQERLARRIGYRFSDAALLERALRHRSCGANNNERLEFLGDSILNFIIAAELYERFPQLEEGELTRLRAGLVKQETLAKLARELQLGGMLQLGPGEYRSGGHDRDSILSDAVEALFAAVLLDGDIETARRVVIQLYLPLLESLNPDDVVKDPKTQLQELLQKHALPTPIYEVREINGQAHKQTFIVECRVSGLDETIVGRGSSRRSAEQQAAAKALDRLTHDHSARLS